MKLNNIIKINIIALFSILATSCSDLLDEKPDSFYDSNSFFKNAKNVDMSILGIYDCFAKQGHFGQAEMCAFSSDDMYHINGTNSDNDFRDLSHYKFTPQNKMIQSMWTFKYQGLDRANFVIENVKKMSGYEDDNLLKQYLGEAYFLRAMISYDLVRYWGDVPYKTTPTSAISQSYTERVDRENIYDQIVEDLNFAKSNLPWAQGGSNPERATQGAARALLMRVLLSRSGYKLQADGNLSCPADNIRKTYFDAVIEEYKEFEKNGYHGLFSNFYTFFKNNSQGILNSKESLFEISFFTPTGTAEDAGFWGTFIGPATDINSPYNRANAFFRVLPEWDDWYEANDIRRVTNICKYQINAKGDSIPTARNNWYPGKWRRHWTGVKGKDPNNTDINFCLLRYADVLLMYAEALNETGQSIEAINIINIVRSRANVTLLKTDLSNYVDIYKAPKVKDLSFIDDSDIKGKIRTVLYWERGFELCYESTRKNDLLRWGILNEAIKDVTSTTGPGYGAKANYTKGKNELYPIPQKELDSNFKLEHKNNPGY